MSYHILHQFDEQWLLELKQEAASRRVSLGDSSAAVPRPARQAKADARERQRWVVVVLAVLIAAFSLLFAIDATQRTEALQQRLDALETTVRN